jgi:hypothetical protein
VGRPFRSTRPNPSICDCLLGRLRFEFQAEDAVYAGVLTSQQYTALSGKYLTLAHFNQFHCVRESIIEAIEECNVEVQNAVLAVRDNADQLQEQREHIQQ